MDFPNATKNSFNSLFVLSAAYQYYPKNLSQVSVRIFVNSEGHFKVRMVKVNDHKLDNFTYEYIWGYWDSKTADK